MSRIRRLRSGREQSGTTAADLPHILLVVDQLPRALGGGERIVLKMAEQLPAYGYRVSILTFAADERSAALTDVPCPIYLLPLRRTYDMRAALGALALRRFLREQRVALVHTCFESSDLWAGGMTKLFSRAKLVWNRRDMGILRGGKHRLAYRWLARMPDAVFAVSEEVRRYSIAVDRIAPERVVTIHNGLNLEQWPAPLGGERRPGSVVSLGNLRPVKGHDVLLRAFLRIAEEFPGATLALGGAVLEPAFKEELDVLVRGAGLTERISFPGSIRDQQGFLKSAAVFVLPSRSEGFSNAIVEAMAASLPVIATAVGGNAEAVVDGETGFIVASEDVDAMAEAMRRLLRDPERAAAMGCAGRERVAEHFTTEAMMQRVTSTFRRLLQ